MVRKTTVIQPRGLGMVDEKSKLTRTREHRTHGGSKTASTYHGPLAAYQERFPRKVSCNLLKSTDPSADGATATSLGIPVRTLRPKQLARHATRKRCPVSLRILSPDSWAVDVSCHRPDRCGGAKEDTFGKSQESRRSKR